MTLSAAVVRVAAEFVAEAKVHVPANPPYLD